MDDAGLLSEFVRNRSQDAFRGLVERYAGLVYAAARRQTRGRQSAEDVVQAVFWLLARKAHRLNAADLPGWLLRAAYLSARNVLRAEARHRRHEQLACAMNPSVQPAPDDAAWSDVAPVLDAALAGLSDTDRTLVARRYLMDEPTAQIALSMNLSPAAVRRRCDRALEKLRRMLERRGFTLSTAGLSAMLAASAAEAAPPALVAAAVAAATGATGTLAGGGGVAAVAKGALLAMTLSKAQSVAVGVAISIVLVGGSGLLVYESMRSPAHRPEVVDIAPPAPAQLPPGGRSAAPPLPPINFGNLAIRPAAIKLGEEIPLHPLLVLKAQGVDEPALTAWLEAWDRRVHNNEPTTPAHLAELEPLLKATKLSCMGLYQIGRGMALVAGKDDAALVWYKAAGERAEAEAAGYRPDEPAAEAFVVAMRRMRDAMWATHEYDIIRTFCAAELRLVNPDSDAGFLAACVYADSSYMESGRRGGDADLLKQTVQFLTPLLNRSNLSAEQRSEVQWLLGICLYDLRRYEEALRALEQCLAVDGRPYGREALRLCITAYIAVGNGAAARAACEKYMRLYRPDPSESIELALMLEGIGL